ncbi:cell wall protein DAN4-like isoform X2 [Teleopsis dalmanni]|uniref:cell wall protein DAN4-like isoform X2 n=1 Tax=Teleopsis dalmanni TaxID=139649 RepID=UPI0018CE5F44|nr:cell wall protein DAN4-like isoform X2 [Teleopsis dalmanni]
MSAPEDTRKGSNNPTSQEEETRSNVPTNADVPGSSQSRSIIARIIDRNTSGITQQYTSSTNRNIAIEPSNQRPSAERSLLPQERPAASYFNISTEHFPSLPDPRHSYHRRSITSKPSTSKAASSACVPSSSSSASVPSTSRSAYAPGTSSIACVPSTSRTAYAPGTFSSDCVPSTSRSAYAPSSFSSALVPSTSRSAYAPSTFSSALVPSTSRSAYNPDTFSSDCVPSTSRSAYAPSTFSSALVPSTSRSAYAPSTFSSALVPSTSRSAYAPSTFSSALVPSTSRNAYAPRTFSSALVPSTSRSAYALGTFSSDCVPSTSRSAYAPSTFSSALVPSTSGASESDIEEIIVHPNGDISNVRPSVLNDQYGILSILSMIRIGAPSISHLNLGIDLNTLGIPTNSNELLYPRFSGPFGNEPLANHNMTVAVPREYLMNNAIVHKITPLNLEVLSDDTLFYIFYICVREKVQLEVAVELFNRQWRFHKDMKVWFRRALDRAIYRRMGNREEGLYIYFDPNQWQIVSEFLIIYDQQVEAILNLSFCQEFFDRKHLFF